MAVFLTTIVLLGISKPLADPDFPMHLAVGEWIARHHAVPFVEPFAWTRPGAPYYAYSWLAQLAFYAAYEAFGALGPRVLFGVLLAAPAIAVGVLGRVLGWRRSVTAIVAVLNIIASNFIVFALRPQLVLFTLVPLSWAAGYRLLRSEHPWRPALALLALNCIAANTHLFFPLAGAPAVLLWVQPPRERRRALLMIGAIVGGWLLSPYALVWPQVFLLNFRGNALTHFPSPIIEYTPGFSSRLKVLGVALPCLIALLLLPFGLRRVELTRREEIATAVLWIVGLAGFAYGVRLLLVWWLSLVPTVGRVLTAIGGDEEDRPPRRALRLAAYAVFALLAAASLARGRKPWNFEASDSRRLASDVGVLVDPLTTWLETNTAAGSGGRAYSGFDVGGYLTWRLHGAYSAASDSRGVFPDSIVISESYVRAYQRPVTLGPWRKADIALFPSSFIVADSLNAAPEWRRAAYVAVPGRITAGSAARDTIVLWVRDDWWRRAGRIPLERHGTDVTPEWMRALARDPRPDPAASYRQP
ncbi:MAG TPA: hypothetical protein VFS05_04920 [Gemmatimonadaceae bacterium]|nr:hypothetical protein [Gemmatimonadaceae bacterium]